ncbi:MAG: hypothetical protein ACK5LN_03745 [Propioniciclava sp.]
MANELDHAAGSLNALDIPWVGDGGEMSYIIEATMAEAAGVAGALPLAWGSMPRPRAPR